VRTILNVRTETHGGNIGDIQGAFYMSNNHQ